MASSLEIKVDGFEKVKRRVRTMQKRASDCTPVWPKVGRYLSNEIRKQFVSEGTYFTGEPWQPLTPKYKTWKLSHGGINKILRFSGDMMKTFTSRPMQIERYYPDHAEFGSEDPKAIWHQKGTHRNGKRVNPPRPIVVKTPEMKQGIRDILDNYIVGKRGD